MQLLSFVYLPILFFIYNASEIILKINHASICENTGCLLADSLLRFDSIYLNYIGTWVAFVIVLLGWSAYKGNLHKKFFYLVVFVALVFETIMLGYQYFVSPEMCKFCMGIYAFLALIMLFSSRRYFFMILPVIGAVLVALSFLAIPKQKAFIKKDGIYLIHSQTCSHCRRVKKYFKDNNISYEKIDIDLVEAKNFSTFVNFQSIPTVVIKKGKQVKIINGDSYITDYFDEQKKPEVTPVQEEVTTPIDVNSLYQNSSDEEGCGFAAIVKKDKGCESER